MSARRANVIVSIQYLRAAAALMVVFDHGWEQLPWFQEQFPYYIGRAGVDIFFVISGFVMVYVTKSGARPIDFLRSRIIRVVPLYWILTCATAVLLIWTPSLFRLNTFTINHFLLSLFFIAHSSPSEPDQFLPMIKLGWTLNYEMFFYVIFALAIAVSPRQRIALTTGIMILLVTIGAVIGHSESPVVNFYTSGIILEFVFGMFLARLYLAGNMAKLWWPYGYITGTLGLAGLYIGAHYYDSEFLPRVIFFGIPALAVVAGSLMIESSTTIAVRQPFLLLGDASYSIYLCHMFPIAILRMLWRSLDLPMNGWVATTVFMSACILVGSGAGLLCYILLEKPILTLMRRALAPRPVTSAAVEPQAYPLTPAMPVLATSDGSTSAIRDRRPSS
jgi:exopolysaccharide production protein ExoZ